MVCLHKIFSFDCSKHCIERDPLQAPGIAGSLDGEKSKDLKNLSDLLDTHQVQPTEVRHQTRSRSSPLPGHETQTLQAGIEDIEVISKGGDSVALLKSLEEDVYSKVIL
ncbi:Nucleic acid-binding OB-fold [Penicillium frequentans]|uniref:Nucleic acid-binding OB-fold n=1 Tax=Penicillium frequentans TaxID=3151616 RepID=A0AAD6GKJ9_9EURO|nr:Nucleic acid-binding OB-fold [Penicillium glabrum]